MKKLLFFLLSAVFLTPATAQTDPTTAVGGLPADTLTIDTVPAPLPWPLSLQVRLDSLVAAEPLLEVSQMGLMVFDLSADSTLYTYNHRHTLRPGSTMKLVTAIAALDRLGGNYKFRTSLYYTGQLDSCTLRGDLYCVGGMAPKFEQEDLSAFVQEIKALGIDTIRGRIVADKSMKEPDTLGWGWCWDDDNPVLSPLLVGKKDEFTERFAQQLMRAGVVVDAELAEGRLPERNTVAVCSCYHTLDQVLPRMMKDSDNLFAESVFYQLGLLQGGRPATLKSSRAVVNKLIEKVGLRPSDYIIADGSGLSLYNYLSPQLEVALLRYAWRNYDIRGHLYPVLPIAGQDGTLEKRMRRTAAAGNVHAKTGTLKAVTSLGGYCRAANGHMLCFAIMNQGVMQINRGRDLQDRICVLLCDTP